MSHKIEVGQYLKTNYDAGPYKVMSITRGCTCTHILDEIENIENPLPPHVHMVLKTMTEDHNKGKDAYLLYYDEETLESVAPGDHDKLILLENPEPVQRSLSLF